MSAISIDNISKTYPPPFPRLRRILPIGNKTTVEALSGITLDIAKGEVFGLIGKNGAGKTTLTKIIATLVQPTSGKVSVFGHDSIDQDVKVRSLLGLATAEERSFYWRLTCHQNLMFFSRLYGMRDRDAKKRIAELFEIFGLSDNAKRRFSDLSTGNKQKLAVARAMLPEPPLLLLDEPTRSLDPLAAAEMRTLIESLKDVTVLLTSHNLSEIEELCGRVAVISRGVIRTTGSPAELRAGNSETQTVRIEMSGATEESLNTLNKLRNFQMERVGNRISITFDRDQKDGVLGATVSELTEKGVNITDIDTERATLLDVLEQYD